MKHSADRIWLGGTVRITVARSENLSANDNKFESLPVKSFLTWTFDGEFICVVPWVVCYTAVFSV